MSISYVETNATRLLSLMVEQNLCETSNAELQSLSDIEDGNDVNDAVDWLEEIGAIDITRIQATANPVYFAEVKLTARGRSKYEELRSQKEGTMNVGKLDLASISLDVFVSHSGKDTRPFASTWH